VKLSAKITKEEFPKKPRFSGPVLHWLMVSMVSLYKKLQSSEVKIWYKTLSSVQGMYLTNASIKIMRNATRV